MNLGRVCGRVTATVRVAELRGDRLALVAPVDESGAAIGPPLVALDPLVRAAAGTSVWFVNGWDAVDALETREPVDAVIVGLADEVRR